MRQYLKEYFLILGDQKSRIPVLLFYFLMASLLDVLGLGLVASYIPVIIGESNYLPDFIINFINYLNLNPENLYIILGLFIVGVYCLKAIISFDIQKRIIKFSLNVELNLRDRLMNAYMMKPFSFFLTENSSNIINNIGIYANTFQSSTVSQSLKLIVETLVILSIIILIFIVNPYFTLAIAFLIGLFFLGYDLFIKVKITQAGKTASLRFGNVIKYVNQAIFGIKEVKILQKEDFFVKKLRDEVTLVNNARFVQDSLKLIPKYAIEFLLVLSTISMVIVLQYFGEDRTEILTKVAIFVVAGTRLLPSTSVLISSLSTLRAGRFVVSELSKVLGSEAEFNCVEKKSSSNEVLKWNDEILFKDISFKYNNSNKYLFSGVTFSIKKGESIGIIGESGSGKTTLINLLLSLLDYEQGDIFVDGVKFSDRKLNIQNSMSYIPQNIFLLDDSVRNNIAFGVNQDEINNEILDECIKKSKLLRLVDSLPEGLDTLIGERGIRFSGGQQQRLAIARALYSKREILILDEATSALDDNTEREIVREINLLKGKFTVIVIAHRLSTLKDCDRIISIENGQLVIKK